MQSSPICLPSISSSGLMSGEYSMTPSLTRSSEFRIGYARGHDAVARGFSVDAITWPCDRNRNSLPPVASFKRAATRWSTTKPATSTLSSSGSLED